MLTVCLTAAEDEPSRPELPTLGRSAEQQPAPTGHWSRAQHHTSQLEIYSAHHLLGS